jgi:hypothetical protein
MIYKPTFLHLGSGPTFCIGAACKRNDPRTSRSGAEHSTFPVPWSMVGTGSQTAPFRSVLHSSPESWVLSQKKPTMSQFLPQVSHRKLTLSIAEPWFLYMTPLEKIPTRAAQVSLDRPMGLGSWYILRSAGYNSRPSGPLPDMDLPWPPFSKKVLLCFFPCRENWLDEHEARTRTCTRLYILLVGWC